MLGASRALSMKGNSNRDSWNLCASATQATAGREASAHLAPQARSKSTQGTVLRIMVCVLLQQGQKGAVSAISTPIHGMLLQCTLLSVSVHQGTAVQLVFPAVLARTNKQQALKCARFVQRAQLHDNKHLRHPNSVHTHINQIESCCTSVSGSTSLMSGCTVEVVLVEVWNISCCCSVTRDMEGEAKLPLLRLSNN